MKKIIALVTAAALLLAMTACSQETQETEAAGETQETADYSNTTLTGQVTQIDGSTVTLLLGELSESEGMDSAMEAPEKPEGSGDAAEPSQIPENGEAPDDIPQGEGGEVPDDVPQGGDGEAPDDVPQGGGGEAPSDMPDGGMGGGAGGDMGGGMNGGMGATFTAGEETAIIDLSGAAVVIESGMETTDGSLEDLAVGDVLEIQVGDDNAVQTVTVKNVAGEGAGQGGDMGGQGGSMGGGSFGGSGDVTQGTSANTIDTDGTYTDQSYTSTGDDENALRVDGATVTLEGITVDKSAGASSNTEDGDFYGMNAALLATNGANVTIADAQITSSAQNGNGVFSYGEGTVVNISDSTITTTADNSGGIQTTGGGTTNASNLTVETSGSSAAAIRSDRGGGTVNVNGGSYTSNGYNSPAVYSTAEITVENATLTANNSEALVIEGANSMTLIDCIVYGNMSDTQGTSSDENVHNVMIYQSMSGDADVGTSTFSMTGGSLTSNNGDMIYVTNTHCILTLSGVEIMNNETDGYLLLVSGNSGTRGWGSAGANGAQVEFTADSQVLEGDIAVDTVSTLTMTMTNGTVFTGTINIIENAEGGAAVENNAVVTVGAGCTWNLTGNCTLTSLENNGTINFNGYTITLADGTVLSA